LVTPLRAQNYALAPLEFAAPAWCLIMGRAHVTVIWDPIGRPPDIPENVKAEMISALVAQLPVLQSARGGSWRSRKDPAVMKFVRELATRAEVKTSDYTLGTQIIRPAFKRWQGK
jgi:hypothetical protein